jgi:enoyl-CoA hydratase/carnithine racemase
VFFTFNFTMMGSYRIRTISSLRRSISLAGTSQRTERPFFSSANKQGWAVNACGPVEQLDTEDKTDHRVQCEIDNTGIARVTLNRPSKMNALDMAMFEAIADTCASLKSNLDVRAVILSGSGRAFCTGLDVPSLLKLKNHPVQSMARLLERSHANKDRDSSEQKVISNLAQDVGYLWRDLPVPVIACLHGSCLGGGLQIALGADIRLVTPDCKLSVMEAKWGLIPDMSASVTLRELVRIDVAKELTMTGRVVSGEEAAELGLATRCVEDPIQEAETLAEQILQRSPDSIAMTKKLYQQTWVAPEEYCLRLETKLQKKLLGSWNQLAASGRNFGWSLPYFQRKSDEKEVG